MLNVTIINVLIIYFNFYLSLQCVGDISHRGVSWRPFICLDFQEHVSRNHKSAHFNFYRNTCSNGLPLVVWIGCSVQRWTVVIMHSLTQLYFNIWDCLAAGNPDIRKGWCWHIHWTHPVVDFQHVLSMNYI
jgi:hypothetical protein